MNFCENLTDAEIREQTNRDCVEFFLNRARRNPHTAEVHFRTAMKIAEKIGDARLIARIEELKGEYLP